MSPCTRNTGPVSSLSTDLARSISDPSIWSLGRGILQPAIPNCCYAGSSIAMDAASSRGTEVSRASATTFSNRSHDIRGIFAETLEQLSIPHTFPSTFQVAVYRKRAVAYLDTLIGPKR